MPEREPASISAEHERVAFRRAWFVIVALILGLLALSFLSSEEPTQRGLKLSPLFGLSEGEPVGEATGYWALQNDALFRLSGRGVSTISVGASPCGQEPDASIVTSPDIAITQISKGTFRVDTRFAGSDLNTLIVETAARECQIATDPRTFYFRIQVNQS